MLDRRTLHVLLALTPLICYLQWGGGHAATLAEIEWQILTTTKDSLQSLLHPFFLLPLLGQIALLVTAFTKKSPLIISIGGQVLLSLIVFMVALSGILTRNLLMLASAVPFIIVSVLFYRFVFIPIRH